MNATLFYVCLYEGDPPAYNIVNVSNCSCLAII